MLPCPSVVGESSQRPLSLCPSVVVGETLRVEFERCRLYRRFGFERLGLIRLCFDF
jgi:hypothetical protein